jgi:hypothetical protein
VCRECTKCGHTFAANLSFCPACNHKHPTIFSLECFPLCGDSIQSTVEEKSRSPRSYRLVPFFVNDMARHIMIKRLQRLRERALDLSDHEHANEIHHRMEDILHCIAF